MKRNSQHYRFASFVGDIPSETNLCPYIRKFIGGLTLFLFLSTLFAVVLVGNGMTIYSMFAGDFVALVSMDEKNDPWFIITSFITFTLGLVLLFFYGLHLFSEWRMERRYARYEAERAKEWAIKNGEYVPEPPPEPSFLRQWYDSVHNKVCPVIKFD